MYVNTQGKTKISLSIFYIEKKLLQNKRIYDIKDYTLYSNYKSEFLIHIRQFITFHFISTIIINVFNAERR